MPRKPRPPPEGSEQRMREHWDTGFIMEIDGVVDYDSEADFASTRIPLAVITACGCAGRRCPRAAQSAQCRSVLSTGDAKK